jgi:hypothetical protein
MHARVIYVQSWPGGLSSFAQRHPRAEQSDCVRIAVVPLMNHVHPVPHPGIAVVVVVVVVVPPHGVVVAPAVVVVQIGLAVVVVPAHKRFLGAIVNVEQKVTAFGHDALPQNCGG